MHMVPTLMQAALVGLEGHDWHDYQDLMCPRSPLLLNFGSISTKVVLGKLWCLWCFCGAKQLNMYSWFYFAPTPGVLKTVVQNRRSIIALSILHHVFNTTVSKHPRILYSRRFFLHFLCNFCGVLWCRGVENVVLVLAAWCKIASARFLPCFSLWGFIRPLYISLQQQQQQRSFLNQIRL